MNRRDLLKMLGLGAMSLVAHESGILLLDPKRVYSFPKEIKLYNRLPDELKAWNESRFYQYLRNKSYVIPPPGVPTQKELMAAFRSFGSGVFA